MKKFLIIIGHFVVIFAILISVGIFNRNNRSEAQGKNEIFTGELEKDPNGRIIKLKILENDTARDQGYLDELLNAFNAAFKEYGIMAEDANQSESSDLVQNGPYGFGPDVLYQANDQIMGYVDGRHLMQIPIELVDDYNLIDENAWNAYNRDGAYYGVPINVQEPLLYYNKSVIPDDWETTWDDDKNGVPDMLESWPALYRFSEELKNDGNSKTWGFMESYDQPYMQMGYLFSYGAYIFGDNDTDPTDVGINAGNAYLGLNVARQQASQMDERCVDNSITTSSYTSLASGEFFCTLTTPDVYTRFVEAFGDNIDNLGVATMPQLPVSGDLTDEDGELFRATQMGGINGYAISAYTDYPNASLAFINFATNYEMINKRAEMLGIVPARKDIAEELDEVSQMVYDDLENGYIYVMPSISELNQVWKVVGTMFIDLAKDPFRIAGSSNPPKFDTLDKLKAELDKVKQNIIDALTTLG